MNVTLKRHEFDSDMIELTSTQSVGNKNFPMLWAVVHIDCLNDVDIKIALNEQGEIECKLEIA